MSRPPQGSGSVFTGRTRSRTASRSVMVADRLARWVIALGGIGSIAAVSLVGLFLLYVALPLFIPSRINERDKLDTGVAAARVVHMGVNEYATQIWSLHEDGSIDVRSLRDGRVIRRLEVPDADRMTCWSFGIDDDRCGFGYADGTVRLGRFGFKTEFVDPISIPARLRSLAVGDAAPLREGIVERTPENQFRYQSLAMVLDDPRPLSSAPIVRFDQSQTNRGVTFVALDREGLLHVRRLRERRNLLTGKVTQSTEGDHVDLAAGGWLENRTGTPIGLLLTGLGDNALLAWSDGHVLRMDTSKPGNPRVVEATDLVPETDGRLTAVNWQIGKTSLVTGDDRGRVRVWFCVRRDNRSTADGQALVLAHELNSGPASVTALAPSARTRMMAVGFSDGTMAIDHVTSEQRLIVAAAADEADPVDLVVIGPRDDVAVSLAAGTTRVWEIDAAHPEINWTVLMGKVWYEGYNAPAWVWQSSSATDSSEPKFSLVPLIFGTIKATFYSLLFGLPLAWMAAIFTSEFLHPRSKARIKPVIELMASLPSVVLGFLAALVFAPLLETVIPHTLTALVTVPFCFLLGAYLWQLVPKEQTLRWSGAKFPLMFLGLPAGLLLAWALAPGIERTLFAGDIIAWLDSQIGSGLVGWMVLLIPVSAGIVFLVNIHHVDTWFRHSGRQWTRTGFALADLGRFLVSAAAMIALAWTGAWLLTEAGVDPRGGYLDTYVQRNALVVGVVMGFAIIPIIYTISEDALSAVPEHLRAASLGAGATPWQTAVLVVVPPAMSGLFSAMMIGLGRAVGETMVVLMAAGNTPVMEWNIFNGFRTLSANIAVELPEAVQNSTHYRTLFLAALTLFVLTFVLNTAAETVRIRFRKKSLEL